MKFQSSLVSLALMSFVVASGQQVSTLKQTVTTMAKGKTVSVATRQVRVVRKPAPAVMKPRTDSLVTRILTPAKVTGTKGAKKLHPSVLPGYPDVTINAQNFGSVAVGGTPASMTLTYTFPDGVTGLYANFANGLDFSGANSTCTSTGCSATFTFSPRYPGLAKDALVIVDQNNNPVYETLVYGTGTAPQFGFDLGGLSVNTGVTNQPDSIAIGPDGNLYLTDASQNAVYKFGPGVSSREQLEIEIGTPGGIAVDGENTVYVADKSNNVIVAYNEATGAQTTLSTSQLSNPSGVAVDGTGAVYIVDTGNGRIIKIDNQGNETTVISGIDAPTSIAVDTQGDVFYADAGNGGEVTVLSQGYSGNAISLGTQMGTLYDMAVDAAGRLYISTPNGDTLISPEGSMVEYGGGANYGMAVDLAGNIYTTQPSGGSVAETNRSVSNFILSTVVDTTTTGGDTISNTGNTNLLLSNIAISGTVFTNDPSSQCVASTTLAPGNTCNTEVDFTPTAAQSYQESYTVTSNSLNVTTSTNVDTLYGYGIGAATSTALAVSSNPVITGQPVTFTATVTRTQGSELPAAGGTVNFLDGTTVLGSGTLPTSGNTAQFSTSSLAAGIHSITAMYAGDTYNAPSTSAAQSLLVTAGNTSTTSLTSTPAALFTGQKLTFTAAVSGSAPATPTGTVTLTNTSASPAVVLGTITLDTTGQGTFSTTHLAAGEYSVTATYNGDATYNPSTSGADRFEVGAPDTTNTDLTVTPATVAYEGRVTLSANVYVEDNVTSGQVIFCDAASEFCNATTNLGIAQVTANGTAVLTLGSGTIGTHQYTATYLGLIGAPGSPSLSSSTSEPQTVTVTGTYPTTTAIAATATGGGNYGLTGTVVGFGTSAAQPRGSVSFLDASNANASLATGILGFATLGFAESPSATSPYTVGSGPYGQATGDFNGDGFLDIVVQNYESNTVSVLLGNGDGTFQPQVTYPVGSEPERVLVADLNGDGFLDLIVANTGSSSISVLLGNGDGTFQAQVTYQCGSPVGLGVMDINHDGFPDVVAGDYYDGSITVLLGNGDGTLQAGVTYQTGSTPQTLAEGDFNGDGNVDVAVGNFGVASVGIFLGNGDGTFQPMVTYAVGNQPQGVQVGDFNGDGKPDLAVSNSADNTVGVLLGNGDGTFQSQVTYAVGTGPVGVVVADFNGDGYQDISVGNTGSNTQSVLLGNGDGTFQAQLTFPTGTDPYGDTVGDFNGDGYPDISVSNFVDGTVTILLSQVTQTATGIASVTVTGSAEHDVEASFPGDGNFSASVSQTTPLFGTGGGSQASTTSLTSTPAAPTVGQAVTFAVAVSPVNGGDSIPSGTVTLMNTAGTPATVLGTITLSGGTGAFSTTSLAQGTYSVTAVYSGDTNFAASTSSLDMFTVSPAPAVATTTTLAVSAATVAYEKPITLTANVAVASGPVTAGQVYFCDAAAHCSLNLNLGVAQLNTQGNAVLRLSPGTIGSHSYLATFAGTSAALTSASADSTVTVTGTYPDDDDYDDGKRGESTG